MTETTTLQGSEPSNGSHRLLDRRLIMTAAGPWLSAIYLSTLIAFSIQFMWPSIMRTWFFSSDEYVFAAEVIRFGHLDFRQQFFDMPGTPLMMIGALIWAIYYGVHWLVGAVPPGQGLGEFTFQHLPALFVALRCITLFCFCLSIVLVFLLMKRLTNISGAWVASLLVAMSPIYASISSFVRVESLCVCYILGGLLCLLHALDETPESAKRQWFGSVAGFLCGLAAATRLHSITASLPVIIGLIMFSSRTAPEGDYPRWVKVIAALATGVLAMLAAWLFFKSEPYFAGRQHAYRMVELALIAAFAGLGAWLAAYGARRTRRTVIEFISPELIRVLVATGVGVIAGMPTVLTQYTFLLGSMEMYSGYRDVARLSWPFLRNAQFFVTFYLNVIAPDRIVLAMVTVGAVSALIAWDKRALAFLIGAVVFFVSKPLTLVAAPHHVVPWLAYFAILAGYSLKALYNLLAPNIRHGYAAASVVAILIFAALLRSITPGPVSVSRDLPYIEERLANIQRATDWLKENTETDATIAFNYFCFGPDVFDMFLRNMSVPVPASVFDSRNYMAWWGTNSALKGLKGYVCMTPSDLVAKRQIDMAAPGEGVDPFTDSRFQQVQSFGSGLDQVSLFKFDFK